MSNLNYTFPLPNGLHARPASFIEDFTKQFKCQITLTNLRNNKTADTSSVLSMISSDILMNDSVMITVEGDETDTTLQQFSDFLNTDFLTCDEPLTIDETRSDQPLPCMLRNETLHSLPGTPVSSGVAKGKAVTLGEPKLTINPEEVLRLSRDEESGRFNKAVNTFKTLLCSQIEHASGDEKAILNAHRSLLEDAVFIDGINEHITAGDSILKAILKIQEHYSVLLGESSSEYLRERVLDIKDLCTRLIIEIYGDDAFEMYSTALTESSICIASALTPSQFLSLDRNHLEGLVLEAAGTTSHTVILARSFGIPVLVGVEGAKGFIDGQDDIILDASLGLLIKKSSTTVSRFYELEQQKFTKLSKRRETYLEQTAETVDGHKLLVAANIASAEEAVAAFSKGAEGIGLFRTEMLFMDRSEPPCEEEQFNIYKDAIMAAEGKPVIIRTMDIGGDKPVEYFNIGQEENPFLGYRAIRLYPEYLSLFHAQLRAILRASAFGNCKIMVPMVASLKEAKWLRENFNSVLNELKNEGIKTNPDVKLGIMLEVPSCAFIIDQLVRYVDFFSIGSNDLTQYLLAADRGNKKVEHLYDSLNPAFLRLLKHIVSEVHKAGSWVGICGEIAGDPTFAPLLVGLGLDEISLNTPGILQAKEAVCQASFAECEKLVVEALQLETREEILALLQGFAAQTKQLPILSGHSILVGAQCQSKAEVIKTLVDNLYINGRISDINETEQAVWDREAISSTMLGFGIAIPHCKSVSIVNNSISIMKLDEPVLWNEGDPTPTDTVIMLNVRASEAGNMHMKIFAQLARRIMRSQFRESLAAINCELEMLEFIKGELEL